MKNLIVLLIIVFSGAHYTAGAQDLIGLTHKQVLEYWQKTVPVDQINDTGDLIRVGENIFCSFGNKGCIDFSIIIQADQLTKYKDKLNADKQLRYDEKNEAWINDLKKYTWKITKSGDAEYEVNFKPNSTK